MQTPLQPKVLHKIKLNKMRKHATIKSFSHPLVIDSSPPHTSTPRSALVLGFKAFTFLCIVVLLNVILCFYNHAAVTLLFPLGVK